MHAKDPSAFLVKSRVKTRCRWYTCNPQSCVCVLVCAGERVKDTDPLWFTLGDYNVCKRYQLGTLCHTKEEDRQQLAEQILRIIIQIYMYM